jgi:ubiquinone/menaquinone biosynthesis C-methylase UbiE
MAPGMVAEATRRHGGVEFRVGDMCALGVADGSCAGLTAFYAIVHLVRGGLPRAFTEWRRVLAPGGALLVAFHVGDEALVVDEFLGEKTTLAWNLFPMDSVAGAAAAAGLVVEARIERRPYATEHPTTRGYLLARRPA